MAYEIIITDLNGAATPITVSYDATVLDGIYITNVEIDITNHLIVTLSDGTTIDAGELSANIPVNLDGLSDVVITTPSNGQVLKYNGTNWVNDTDAGGAVVAWGSITGTLSDQTDLQNALTGEANARIAADGLITASVNAEITARENADLAEQTARIAADGVITASVNAEITARGAADTSLQTNITNETNARIAADGLITASVNAEITARTAADGVITASVNAEVTSRQNADTSLQSNITAEESARSAADVSLQSNITAEANARIAADGVITASVNAEITARTAADLAELTLRTNADLLEITARTAADLLEITARTAADVTLQEGINARIPKSGFPVDENDVFYVTVTYTEATRTITITPTGASYDVYVQGKRYNFVGAQSIQHGTADGGHFIYYDTTGTLVTGTVPWNLDQTAPAAYVFWDNTNSRGIPLIETHHAGRDVFLHKRLHQVDGTQAISGFAATGYTLNAGATDAQITYAIASGVLADEDLYTTTAALADGGTYSIIERVGVSGTWQLTRTNTLPILFSTNTPQYNQFTGATWQRALLTEDQYVNYYVCAVPALATWEQIILIPGQAVYASQALANAETVGSLSFGSFPFSEIAPLYQVTFRFNASGAGSFANTVRSGIVAFTRIIGSKALLTASTQTDHGALTGLTDDDHTQYALTDGASRVTLTVTTPSTGQVLKYNGTTWINDTDSTGVASIALDDITDVVITSATTGQVLKFNGTNWVNDTDETGTTINNIDDIGDVVITSATTGQVLKFNGTNWVNDTDNTGGGGGAIDDLTDVVITTPTTGQVLKYNGTNWVNGTDNEGAGGGAESFAPFLLAGM